MPQTTLGRWTGFLLLLLVALLVWLIVGLGSRGILPGSPLARVLGLGYCGAALATLVLALVSRFRFKDRSGVVVVAIVLGALFTIPALFELVEIARATGLMPPAV